MLIARMPRIDSYSPNAARKGKLVARTRKIVRLRKGFFTTARRHSGVFHCTLNYPKIVLDERQLAAWEASGKKGKPPKARIIVRTHNKKYAARITAQDNLRKENSYLCIKLKFHLFKLLKLKALSPSQVEALKAKVEEFAAQADKLYAGEEEFLHKGVNNPARRLAANRIAFVLENIELIDELISDLHYNSKTLCYEDYARITDKLGRVEAKVQKARTLSPVFQLLSRQAEAERQRGY